MSAILCDDSEKYYELCRRAEAYLRVPNEFHDCYAGPADEAVTTGGRWPKLVFPVILEVTDLFSDEEIIPIGSYPRLVPAHPPVVEEHEA